MHIVEICGKHFSVRPYQHIVSQNIKLFGLKSIFRGVDFKLKTIKLGRDKIRLELWDTAGMER